MMNKDEFLEKARGFMRMALADRGLIGDVSLIANDERCFMIPRTKKSVHKEPIPTAIAVVEDPESGLDLRGAVEFFLASVDPHIPDVLYRNIERRSQQATLYLDTGTAHAPVQDYRRLDYISFEDIWNTLESYFEQRQSLLQQNEQLLERVKRLERALKVQPEEFGSY